jgi:hypothetical protein
MQESLKSLLALALLTGLPASAAPILSDDFDRGVSSVVGAGWTEVESDAVDVSLVNRSSGGQAMQLRDDDPRAIASQLGGISTVGYTNIRMSYEWAATNNTESGDFLWFEWRAGSTGNWTEIAQHALLGTSDYGSVVWDIAGADGLSDFEFRFRVVVDSNNEGAYVDNVYLSGDRGAAIVVNAVPEPGALALAGLALSALALLGRRKALPGDRGRREVRRGNENPSR